MLSRSPFIIFILLILSISCHREGEDTIGITAASLEKQDTTYGHSNSARKIANPTPFSKIAEHNIDTQISQMTLAEKLGQLILLKSDRKEDCNENLFNWAHSGKIGGLILQNQNLADYIDIVENCQHLSPTPLLIGTEEKVSLSNQFLDAPSFPKASSLSAIRNDSIQNRLLNLYVDQCKVLGIHFSFAPSIEQNPSELSTYNFDTFEQQANQIIRRSNKTLHLLQRNNILGFGDSFDNLIYGTNEANTKKSNLLLPAKRLTQSRLSAWKISNQLYQNDSIAYCAPAYVKDYLFHELGFGGLIISEVNQSNSVRNLLYAGNDVFIVKNDVNQAFDSLAYMVKTNILSEENLDKKVRKILKAKHWAFKENPISKKVDKAKAVDLIQNESFDFLIESLFQQSVILVNNYQTLPFNYTYQQDYQLFHAEASRFSVMEKRMNKYGKTRSIPIDWYQEEGLGKKAGAARLFLKKEKTDSGMKALRAKEGTKILVLNQNLDRDKDVKLINTINQLASQIKITVVNFGNPYNLSFFNQKVSSIQVFEKNKTTENYVAELLFGGRTAYGRLPLKLADHLPFNKAIHTPITRLNFASPKELGIDPVKLVGIDAYVNSAIRRKAIPGGQVIIIKKGSVIYNKSFGYHTYNKEREVKNSDLYDLASLTKVTATTLAAMKLHEQQNFNLEDKLSNYFKPKYSRMGRVTLKRLLLHYSNIQANMPVYPFIKNMGLDMGDCNDNFCTRAQLNYSKKVAEKVFMRNDLKEEFFDKALKIKPYSSYKYRYSDVNFNLLQKVIEQKVNQGLDQYLYSTFYRSLNMERCLFQPTKRFPTDRIVPTAFDSRWRKQTLQGFVHDESAALLGGVAGNAGLFSNAEDLAVLYQMLLNGGTYGGKRYLKKETIELFTSKQKGSRRGLGFDKPRKTKYPSYSSKASKATYGHTGFTGTAVWVDPEAELVYIFLSNRIHPKPDNKKLFTYKTRKHIHDAVYRAFDSYELEVPSFKE